MKEDRLMEAQSDGVAVNPPVVPSGLDLEPQPGPESIQVWVCPNCGSWSGSTTLADLDKIHNRRTSMRNTADENPDEWGKSVGTRAVCQICRAGNKGDFERIKVTYLRADHFVIVVNKHIIEMSKDTRG